LLRRGYEHHSDRSWARMLAGLAAGDKDEQIGRAWIAAQELRLLYREPTRDGPNAGCCAGSPPSPSTRSPN
jgi:transposase